MYKTVLVGLDLVTDYTVVFNKAIDIARQNKSDLVIVYIDEVSIPLSDPSGVFLLQHQTEHQDRYKELQKKLEEHAYLASIKNVDFIIKPATSVIHEITDVVAEDVSADLIVCGASKKLSFGDFVIGTVASGIVKYAKTDVFVVKKN